MSDDMKRRGFVTIAIGDKKYKQIALNLLRSYRKFTDDPYPFAIITDKADEYTAEFDDVVIINDARFSFLDKLTLWRDTPYYESIFIDSDTLAYADLNIWWDILKDADDFSAFGKCFDISSDKGWFYYDGIGEFKEKVEFIPDFCGGVYFLRKTEKCGKVFALAKYFEEHFFEYTFNKQCVFPFDEPIFGLAMAVENCRPVDYEETIVNPAVIRLHTDTDKPLAEYKRFKGEKYTGSIVHWSTFKTGLAYYKREVRRMENGMPRGLLSVIADKLSFCVSCLADIPKWIALIYKKRKRIPGKIKRMLKKLFS